MSSGGPRRGAKSGKKSCPEKLRRAGRPVSEEEARLWRHATRAASPLPKAGGRIVDALPADDQSAHEVPPGRIGGGDLPRLHGAGPMLGHSAADRQPARPARPLKVRTPPPPAPPADFDRRKAKKIARGRAAIDARIDLHGMRQRQAHSALRGFLFDCVARGLRTVLVITGKGGPARGGLNDEDGFYGFGGDDDVGVLKRNVPRWLCEADLAAIVVSHTYAHMRHGGEGALYVQLRRRIRPKGQH